MRGKFYHSIDSKGRLIVPSKLRDALGSEFVMTPGLEDHSIYLYSIEEWDNFTEQLNQLGSSKAQNRDLKRFFQANAVDCSIDSQGRTVIPAELREDAEIEKSSVTAEKQRYGAQQRGRTRREIRRQRGERSERCWRNPISISTDSLNCLRREPGLRRQMQTILINFSLRCRYGISSYSHHAGQRAGTS